MAAWHVGRAVLQALEDTGDVADGLVEVEAVEEEELTADTKSLRIAAIFIILATGLLGGIPPLFLNVFRDQEGTLTRLVRSFSAGVILALACVHIIPEAVEEMAELGGIEYPLGGTCVLFGAVLMVFLEHIAHIMHGSHGHESHSAAESALDVEAAAKQQQQIRSSGCADTCSGDAAGKHGPVAVAEVAGTEGPADPYARVSESGHSHVCVSLGPAGNWYSLASPEAVGTLRLRVLAYMFELGCVFHSFIIGIGLGVNTTSTKEVRALLIALAFHQWLEGISLASVILRGGFSVVKGVVMVLTYSLTCPVGIAVGMAISSTYDGESERSRGLQGAFNGVSGGMLLYISLVQLVAEDMGRFVPGAKNLAAKRMLSCAALFLGCASMCLLAIWA